MKIVGKAGFGALLAMLVASGGCSKKEQPKKDAKETMAPDDGKEAAGKMKEDPGTPAEPTADAKGIPAPSTPLPDPTHKVKVSDKDELDVWVYGEGTPVVFAHGGFFWDFLRPLAFELSKKGDYQLILYSRRGHHGKPTGPVTIPEQADDIVKILDALKIDKAHLVGHSYGANISLQAAMQVPDRLASVVLLEPVLASQIKSGPAIAKSFEPVMAKIKGGDLEGGAIAFLAPLGGTKEGMQATIPGSWEDMLKSGANTFFTVEAPAMMGWKVDAAKAKAIKVPTTLISADKTPVPQESLGLVKQWAPQVKQTEMPAPASGQYDHFFPLKAPAETAVLVDEWIKSQKS